MSTENTLWSESKTKSLMDDGTTVDADAQSPPTHVANNTNRVCIFCLDGELTHAISNKNGVSNPVGTNTNTNGANMYASVDIENMPTEIIIDPETTTSIKNKTKRFLVLDLGDLFPCNCAVYTHGFCLQQWLDIEHTCPICRRPIETRLNTTELNLPTTFESTIQNTVLNAHNEDINYDTHTSGLHYTIRMCCYCSFSTILVYLLLRSASWVHI